eukprot:25021-Rhodomonas_salina.2
MTSPELPALAVRKSPALVWKLSICMGTVPIEMANHPLKSSGVAKSWRHRHAAMQANSLDKREPSSEPELLFFQSPRLDLQL